MTVVFFSQVLTKQNFSKNKFSFTNYRLLSI